MSFTVSKNGRLALLNVATQVSFLTSSTLTNISVFASQALRHFILRKTVQHVSVVMGLSSLCRECTCGTFKTGCW